MQNSWKIALLLPDELIQQPFKDGFRVCSQSRQTPHYEPWLARIYGPPPWIRILVLASDIDIVYGESPSTDH
jgi:hypothetical protein